MAWSTGRSIGHLGETKCEDCCDIGCMVWPWSCFCNHNAWTLVLTSTQFINTFKVFRALLLLRIKLQEMKRKNHVVVKKLNVSFLSSMVSMPEDVCWSSFLHRSFYCRNLYLTYGFSNKALYFFLKKIFLLQNVRLCCCRHGEDMIVTPFAQVSIWLYIWCKMHENFHR